MQAIVVKFVPGGDIRGARLKASCPAGTCYVDYPHHISFAEDKHFEAVKKLCKKLGWEGDWICGGLDSGDKTVWVKNLGSNVYLVS